MRMDCRAHPARAIAPARREMLRAGLLLPGRNRPTAAPVWRRHAGHRGGRCGLSLARCRFGRRASHENSVRDHAAAVGGYFGNGCPA